MILPSASLKASSGDEVGTTSVKKENTQKRRKRNKIKTQIEYMLRYNVSMNVQQLS